MDKIGVHVKYG